MSFLSASETVGFSGLPQNISDGTCATQFKMAAEGMPAVCSEMNNFISESSGDEHSYINDNFFHTKFKIDPNELYTFHDSDVIAGEITVSHTEDNIIFADNTDTKIKMCYENSQQDIDMIGPLTDIKEEIKDVIPNGHLKSATKPTTNNLKTSNTKVQKVLKSRSQTSREQIRSNTNIAKKSSGSNSKGITVGTSVSSTTPTTKNSINSCNVAVSSPIISNSNAPNAATFLDVFKREQGLIDEAPVTVKTEPCPPPPAKASVPVSAAKKGITGKPSSKSRRGRGPTMHEALQRIPRRVVPLPNRSWHAPGDELFDCGPLNDTRPHPFRQLDSSSSEDDDHMPNFGERVGCVEEAGAESRGARLALRRAALRRQAAQASAALRAARGHRAARGRAAILKKQLKATGVAGRLPAQTINHLLGIQGMSNILLSQERRQLRTIGWSGGEGVPLRSCSEEACRERALPCATQCLGHVTRCTTQRLYASCLAVFAGGGRCQRPLLPLHDHTPLCTEHAWKRDNYDKINRDVKPRKLIVRKGPAASPPSPSVPSAPPAPSPTPPSPTTPSSVRAVSAPRHKRLPPSAQTYIVHSNHSLSELNACSNSSAYDSSEEAAIGGLSESEYIVTTSNAHELEVEQVPPDDILDSAVLGQIPDEAFTEFFNQAEGGGTFSEGSELARALEAVLDERALDSLADSLPNHLLPPRNKMQVSSVGVEMPSGVSS